MAQFRAAPPDLAPAELLSFDLRRWAQVGERRGQAIRRWSQAREAWCAAHRQRLSVTASSDCAPSASCYTTAGDDDLGHSR